ncbi:MAG TPA: kelch repeat-containing protein [Anaerolineae bacterium]|nr:kelch repeat-containing protein [Anaerolineae bacterium]
MRIAKSGILIVVVLALLPMVGHGVVQENYPRVVDLSRADVTLVGEDNGDWAGYFASPAGDVDGDGLGDLLVGAPMAGNKICPYPVPPGGTCSVLPKGEGVAYLVLGRTLAAGPHAPWSLADADASFLGCEAFSMTARQLYTAGDVNGDGYDDMIISGWKCGIDYTGKAYLVLGRPDVASWGRYYPLEPGSISFLGEQEWDFLSYYVSTAGDVNGDGLDDLLFSSTHYEEDVPCAPGLPAEECKTCCRSALDSAEIHDPTAPVTGTSTTIASMAVPRFEHTATLLPDGSVLAVGGQNTESFVSSAEILSADYAAWSAAGSLSTARSGHTASLLPNGRVLVAGGQNASGSVLSAELFDPATRAWSTTGPMAAARVGHTATLLPNGRVLVVGGRNGTTFVSSAEIYDPGAGSWATIAGPAAARAGHTATLLSNGRVLVVGGQNSTGFLNSAEIYDPAAGTWAPTIAPGTARAGHTATLLPDGRVVVAGGQNTTGFLRLTSTYDPALETWIDGPSPNSARFGHTAGLLPSGRVFMAGGQSDGGSEQTAETLDPLAVPLAWEKVMRLNEGRTDYDAVLLPDGRVLFVGGRNCTNFGKIYLILGRQNPDWGTDYPLGLADASFLGEATEDRIGRSVTGVGDVNGDGYDDFMIGSISSDYGGVDAGQNYLFLGRATPNDPGYDPARPWWGRNFVVVGADASFVGEAEGDESGRRVAGAGDVNGDGYADMIIGAARHGTAGYWAGITHLILGRPAADWGLRFPLQNADASFVGEDIGDQSGRRLSGAGDVNNDGYDDFITGAPHNARGGQAAGSAYLIYGRPVVDWGRYYPLGQADVIYVGKPDIGVAGYDQGWLDDWNGDGIDDLLVAAYGGRNDKTVAGEVYIVFGSDAAAPGRFFPGIPHDYQGWRRLTTEFWDPNTWQDIATAYMIMGRDQLDPEALSLRYEVAENAFYMWRSDQAQWMGPCTPGELVRLSNGAVRFDCGMSTVGVLPARTLQLQLIARWLQPITPTTVMRAWLRTVDTLGRDSGFVEFPWPADVAIKKVSAQRGVARAGQRITYTLTFGNAGGALATGVVLTDTVPVELSDVQFESNIPLTPSGSGAYSWLLGDLAPLQGGTITMTATVNPQLLPGAVFTNTAEISATLRDERFNNLSRERMTVARGIYLPLVFR